MSERFRAFIAMPVTGPAHEALVETQRALRRLAEKRGLGLRWVRPQQLHLTLKFLGDVERAQAETLADIVRSEAARLAPFRLSFGPVAIIGPNRRPRVLHAPIIDDAGGLAELAAAIEAAVEPLGIPREDRPFRPHVTLARFKRPGNAALLVGQGDLGGCAVCLDALVLYESKLGREGNEHVVLADGVLGG